MGLFMGNLSLALVATGALLLIVVAQRILGHVLSSLRKVPGPFAARFSRLWYLRQVARGSFHKLNIELHKQYGPVVRIAPNQYSIDDPKAAKVIYGIGKGYVKHGHSDRSKAPWYIASSAPDAPYVDLFTDRDAQRHAAHRRLVANLYSATSLRAMDDVINDCIDVFVDRISELAEKGEPFDLQFWMQCYAFDVICQITVGKRYGFLDRGTDDHMFAQLHEYLKYCAVIGVVSEIHPFLYRLMSMLPPRGFVHIAQFTVEQVQKGIEARSNGAIMENEKDFLSRTYQLHKENPEKFPLSAVNITCITNIAAGSDTTSISLCAILWNLINNPKALSKLRQEIDQKLAELGVSRIPFKDTQEMSYLQACVKEALRLHPATGLPLARLVPNGGITISGTYFPAGATVGINTWVAHMNQEVFGHDAEVFRPERWLDQSKDRLSLMESYWMPFGAGSRTCIGKNISLLEIYKLIPVLVQRFEFSAYNAEKVKHEDYWLVKQTNMMVKVKTA